MVSHIICYTNVMNHTHPKIIAFVGMPGSGVTTAVDYMTAKGYPKVHFGSVVLKAIDEAGLDINPENEAFMREALRQKGGNDIIAKQIIMQIQHLINAGQHRIIADGLYSWTEFKALKHAFPGELTLIAILAPKHVRHHRLANRPKRPLTEAEATDRDWREIEHLEKGGPITMADHFIINEENIDRLYADIDLELDNSGFYDA